MPSLALSMIVRDAADTLVQCLASASDVVSEIVVGDTGSSDNTIALAQSFGARVFSVPWKDDFAEARNRALAEVWPCARCARLLVPCSLEMGTRASWLLHRRLPRR